MKVDCSLWKKGETVRSFCIAFFGYQRGYFWKQQDWEIAAHSKWFQLDSLFENGLSFEGDKNRPQVKTFFLWSGCFYPGNGKCHVHSIYGEHKGWLGRDKRMAVLCLVWKEWMSQLCLFCCDRQSGMDRIMYFSWRKSSRVTQLC